MKKWVLLLVLLLVVTGIAQAIPDPSAVYCILQGYEYKIRTDEQGNQYGVCVFPDGSECSSWAYYCKCEPNGITCWPGDFSCHWPCKEMRCKEAGESVLVSKCCEGLDELYPPHIFDANCNKLQWIGWLFLCSDCGNGICEDWESRCNCPEDCAQPRIIYVDDDANGLNDGSSWADAFNDLQDALSVASSGDEIRVAQGIYKPDQGAGIMPGDREATFQLVNGVALKGGYAGFGEPDPDARNIDAYETILSGDLDGNDIDVDYPWRLWNEPTRAENSYHVVTASGTNTTALLDGFTITSGSASGGSGSYNWYDPKLRGGGMYNESGSPTITNCIFSRNSGGLFGGGMFNYDSSPILTNCMFLRNYGVGGGMCNAHSSPTLTNCSFTANRVFSDGAGMCNLRNSNPIVINCAFTENSADLGGGGMYNDDSNPKLINCTFNRNITSGIDFLWPPGGFGAGMYTINGSPTLTNCTFSENSAVFGGGMCNNRSSPTMFNCTFIGNLAEGSGGGVSNSGYYSECTSTLTDCTFSANSAGLGGGINNSDKSSMTLINCMFTGNLASEGGGLHNYSNYWSPHITLVNCTFSSNSAANWNTLACDPGHQLLPSTVEMTNCILWDGADEIWNDDDSTITIAYSDIQGGWPGEGNIDADPCFVDPGYWDPNGTPEDANDDFWVDGDYHLRSQAGRWDANDGRWTKDEVTSPCIDAGDPKSPIGYELFPNGGIINMGAYGGTTEASKSYFGKPPCETIVAGDINGDCEVNFLDFRLMALHWCEDNNP